MKILYYIGQHKTGSSALQDVLARNSHRLLQAGILYPAVESMGLAHALRKAMGAGDVAAELPPNIRVPHNALAFKMLAEANEDRKAPPLFKNLPASRQMLLAIKNQIRFLDPRGVVLAAEVFSNFAHVAPGQISRLREALPVAEVQIYCALRRPDDYLAAWQSQMMKFGGRPPPLRANGMQRHFGTAHFDFATSLEGWLAAFPGAEATIRRYSEVRESGGTVEDVMRASGLPFPGDLIPPGQTNPSIPHALIEIAWRGNAALDEKAAKALRDGLLKMAPELDLVPNAEVEMFGAANRALLAERFAPVHARLGDLTGIRPFFPDIDEIARPRPIPELEAMRMALAGMEAPLLHRHLPPAAAEFVLELKRVPPDD